MIGKPSPWILCKTGSFSLSLVAPALTICRVMLTFDMVLTRIFTFVGRTLSSHHYLTLLLGGKLHLAPIKDDVQVSSATALRKTAFGAF